ncbi:MAG: hypothetical protein JWM47_3123, partial [Acidimicrobiales bacterium]|nr:hypothetical protein [Acidimicrobiales bacterium]
WTDGCIGSQEGLYFESSTTVPVHFLMQAELSDKPSSPQRELPYPTFDIDAGVRHLQLLGVKYYLAVTPRAVQAASAHRDLTEVSVSGPWHVYEVADAPLVEGLEYEPVVVRGIGDSQDDWLPTETAWFLDPDRLDVPLAIDGPAAWKRIDAEPVPTELRRLMLWTRQQLGATGPMDQLPTEPRTKLPAVEVTSIEQGDDHLSFDVDEVGVPVLVKVSYFPNWKVSGAQGPYRVTPNLMVVVPTSKHVSMTYGRTAPDLLGAGMTVLGLVGLVWLSRRQALAVEPLAPTRVSRWIDDKVTLREHPAAPPAGRPVTDRDDGWRGPEDPRSATAGGQHDGAGPDGPDGPDGPAGHDANVLPSEAGGPTDVHRTGPGRPRDPAEGWSPGPTPPEGG